MADTRQRGRVGGTRSADVGRAQQDAFEAGRRAARAALRRHRDPLRASRGRLDDADLDSYHEAGFQSVTAGTAPGAVRRPAVKAAIPAARVARRIRRGAARGPLRGGGGISSPWEFVGILLSLILLYLVVSKVQTANAAISGIKKGLEWFMSPKTAIPYAKSGAHATAATSTSSSNPVLSA